MIVGITPYSCQTRTNFTASPIMLRAQMEALTQRENVLDHFLQIAKTEFTPKIRYEIMDAVRSIPIEELLTFKKFMEEFTNTTQNLTQNLPVRHSSPPKENQAFFEQIKRQAAVFSQDQRRIGIANKNYTISDCLQYNLMNLQTSHQGNKNHMEDFVGAVNRILPVYKDHGEMKRLTIDFAHCLEDFIEAATQVDQYANIDSLSMDMNRMIPVFLKVFSKASEYEPYCLNGYNFTEIIRHPEKYIRKPNYHTTSIDSRLLANDLLNGMVEPKITMTT